MYVYTYIYILIQWTALKTNVNHEYGEIKINQPFLAGIQFSCQNDSCGQRQHLVSERSIGFHLFKILYFIIFSVYIYLVSLLE